MTEAEILKKCLDVERSRIWARNHYLERVLFQRKDAKMLRRKEEGGVASHR
jgi:hypothetical protein